MSGKRCLPAYKYLILRWIEFIFCVTCLVYAIYLQSDLGWLSTLLLLPTAAIYTVITGFLVLTNHLLRPIPMNTWLMMSLTAFIQFVICGIVLAILLAKLTQLKSKEIWIWLILAAVFYFLTAVIFLADFIYALLIRLKLKRLARTRVCNIDAIVGTTPMCRMWSSQQLYRTTKYNRLAPTTPHSIIRSPRACGDTQTSHIRRSASRIAPCSEIPITHGGTFPIGNDLTPVVSDGCRKASWTESCATNTIPEDVTKGCSRFERKRGYSSPCQSPPVAVKGQCVRYAIKISPSKAPKSSSSLQTSPRAPNKVEYDHVCCPSCHCLPGEVNREIAVIEECVDATPSGSSVEEARPKPVHYSNCIKEQRGGKCRSADDRAPKTSDCYRKQYRDE